MPRVAKFLPAESRKARSTLPKGFLKAPPTGIVLRSLVRAAKVPIWNLSLGKPGDWLADPYPPTNIEVPKGSVQAESSLSTVCAQTHGIAGGRAELTLRSRAKLHSHQDFSEPGSALARRNRSWYAWPRQKSTGEPKGMPAYASLYWGPSLCSQMPIYILYTYPQAQVVACQPRLDKAYGLTQDSFLNGTTSVDQAGADSAGVNMNVHLTCVPSKC